MDEELEKLSDRALTMGASEGSIRAFEVLFARHYLQVYRLAYRLCGSQEDAQDIAQETFVRVGRSLSTFRREARFTTWVYRITVNATADWQKKAARQRHLAQEYGRENCDSEAKDDISDRVLEALNMLSPGERQAIVLTVFQDMTHAQAAKVLERAETTVSWRVFRAKRKLKRFLEGNR